MKKELEKRNELIGLDEINQFETINLNGGGIMTIKPISADDFIVCCWNIPPVEDRDIFMMIW